MGNPAINDISSIGFGVKSEKKVISVKKPTTKTNS